MKWAGVCGMPAVAGVPWQFSARLDGQRVGALFLACRDPNQYSAQRDRGLMGIYVMKKGVNGNGKGRVRHACCYRCALLYHGGVVYTSYFKSMLVVLHSTRTHSVR